MMCDNTPNVTEREAQAAKRLERDKDEVITRKSSKERKREREGEGRAKRRKRRTRIPVFYLDDYKTSLITCSPVCSTKIYQMSSLSLLFHEVRRVICNEGVKSFAFGKSNGLGLIRDTSDLPFTTTITMLRRTKRKESRL